MFGFVIILTADPWVSARSSLLTFWKFKELEWHKDYPFCFWKSTTYTRLLSDSSHSFGRNLSCLSRCVPSLVSFSSPSFLLVIFSTLCAFETRDWEPLRCGLMHDPQSLLTGSWREESMGPGFAKKSILMKDMLFIILLLQDDFSGCLKNAILGFLPNISMSQRSMRTLWNRNLPGFIHKCVSLGLMIVDSTALHREANSDYSESQDCTAWYAASVCYADSWRHGQADSTSV